MSDWQVSTLRALGLSARGLAGGTPPAGRPDPLTSPVSPYATRRDAPPSFPGAPASHDPRAALPTDTPLGPSNEAAPPAGAPQPAAVPAAPPAPGPIPTAPENPAGSDEPAYYGAASPLGSQPVPAPYSAPSPAADHQAGRNEQAPPSGAPQPYLPPSPAATDQAGRNEQAQHDGTPPPYEAYPAPGPAAENPAGRGAQALYGGIPQPHETPGTYPAPGSVPDIQAGRGAQALHGGIPQTYETPVVDAGQAVLGHPGVPQDLGAGAYGAPVEEDVWVQGAPSSGASGASGADELVRRMRHGDPLARRMGRGVRRAVGARAAQTVREQEAAAGILGQVVSSCRRIAVTSLRGGAGKTTVTALVARTIAAHRADRTLVLDADPSLGSLPLRVGVDADRSYRGLTTLPNWEAAQSYLTQAGERLWVASAAASRALTNELTLAEFQTAQGEFSRYFGISLVDCGPGLTSDLHQGILASSHAQILIAPATADGALSTRSALDWFLRSPHAHLLQRTLVVMVTHTPHLDGDLNRSRALLAAEGVPVIHLPYDRHLAAGTAVDPSLVAETSQATAIHIATAAFTRATT